MVEKINKIFIINLDKDVKRLSNAYDQLDKYEFKNYEKFTGIYGKQLSNDEINDNTTIIGKLFASHSMIGCSLSHIRLWEKIVKENIELSLILEDDFVFYDDFKNKINNVLLNVSVTNNYDMIHLSSCIFHNKFLKLYNINDYFYKQLFIVQTLSYIITLEGAKKLLKYINKVSYHIDLDICFKSIVNYNHLNIISVKDPLVYQTFEDSNNTDDREFPLLINNLIPHKDLNYLYKTCLLTINFDLNLNKILIFLMGYYIIDVAVIILVAEYIYKKNNKIYDNLLILILGWITRLILS
jgi:glycosyl transferase family 25